MCCNCNYIVGTVSCIFSVTWLTGDVKGPTHLSERVGDNVSCALLFRSKRPDNRWTRNEKRAKSGRWKTSNEERVREICKIGNLLAFKRNSNLKASVGANVKFRKLGLIFTSSPQQKLPWNGRHCKAQCLYQSASFKKLHLFYSGHVLTLKVCLS